MSEIKVNKISPRAACGTVTLGDSGDTFTIPAGATITNAGTANGFGATGAVNWQTTVKTSGFTAVAGEGYFVNTTGGEISVNLPAGTAGAVVGIKDYAGTFDTNKVTLVQNGSDKIGGSTDNPELIDEGIAVTLVFVDSTQGWLVTDSGLQSEVSAPTFIEATGGTITNTPTCRIHTFTGPGTFQITRISTVAANNALAYMVVAGGGAGGGANAGSTGGAAGGGAGGFREGRNNPITPYTASPLAAACSALTGTVDSFPITVGAAGTGQNRDKGTNGSPSTFSTITSTGGGGGGARAPSPGSVGNGADGGSGGGGAYGASTCGTAGSGNTPPTTPPQGNNGAAYSNFESGSRPGGGGGAGAAGFPAGGNCRGGNGGTGVTTSINATPTAFAGGGGGAAGPAPTAGGTGGPGGGADGSSGAASNAGTVNTGGGGGGRSGAGQSCNTTGGNGGSGIVIIRYKIG
jgi:hypothetical protein